MEGKLDQEFRCALNASFAIYPISGAGMVAASRKRKSGNNKCPLHKTLHKAAYG
jgi:hypothetical protein